MKGKDMTISVRRLPNGYAMDIGGFKDGRKKRQYMYFSAEQLIAGFFLHFGCKEVEYIDTDEMDALVTACATWPDVSDAYKTIARLTAYTKELQRRVQKFTSETSTYKNKCQALREEIKQLKEQLKEK